MQCMQGQNVGARIAAMLIPHPPEVLSVGPDYAGQSHANCHHIVSRSWTGEPACGSSWSLLQGVWAT